MQGLELVHRPIRGLQDVQTGSGKFVWRALEVTWEHTAEETEEEL